MDTNVIYCGDNTEVMRRYINDNSIDLIYADPPFFSNKAYEVLWGDGYELRAFEDRWKGGINNYIAWMEPKLRECHRVLKDTGSMYLHCDWHASHHLKVLMDRIFGEKLVNEIIWKRTSAHTGEGKIRSFGIVHDVILFYSKSDSYIFNPQYMPYDKEYTEKFYRHKDKDGRRWTSSDLMAAGIRHGDSGKPWRGVDPNKRGNHWKFTVQKLDELAEEGRIYFPKKVGGVPRYKRYLDEMQGQLLQDIWTDIPPVSSHAKERQGYPTQKPEALLERIVNTSSNPMDIVLDPFCGCGTTLVVANKLGRRWIGIDVSPTACKLMGKRLRKYHAKYTIVGLPRTVTELHALQPFEFQNWVFEKLHGRVNPKKIGDLGIDGWIELDVPVQVKQSENVGREVVDKFETAIRRFGKKKGVIVAFSFTRNAYDEVARVKMVDEMRKLEIKLKTVEEILKES
jgi:DNA modification methylase